MPLDCDVVRDQVIVAITRAFDGVSRENAITLHEAQHIIDYGLEEERNEARALDTESHWQEVPDETIERCPLGLIGLCPVGFRYYLPAHLLWILRHYRTSAAMVVDNTLSMLVLSGRKSDLRPAKFGLLSPAQSRAVCLFLWYLVACGDGYVDEDSVQEALTGYWSRFCRDTELEEPCPPSARA